MDCNFKCTHNMTDCGFCELDGGDCDMDNCTLAGDCGNCRNYEDCEE